MMGNKGATQINFLLVGLEPAVREILSDTLERGVVSSLAFDLEKMMDPVDPPPHVVLCGPPPAEISLIDVAQTLRMVYQDVPIHFVSFSRAGYDRKIFVKNGFTDAFLLPMDSDILKRNLVEHLSKITRGEVKSYRAVKLLDIEPGEVLDFDTTIYLPANKRYLKYSNAGDALEQEQVARLTKHNMSAVYVSTDQLPKFYEYNAQKLKKIGASGALSATEKKEKLESSVRDLMTGLFNDTTKDATFEQGKQLLGDCREIANKYILSTPSGDWYKRLSTTMGEMASSHSHSANVSTYAALFSIGLGIGDPAELAMAGLLHDIGLNDIPYEIVKKTEAERSREGQALYMKHPEIALEILKKKKLILSDKLVKIILQHHECFNGSGYPHGLGGEAILKEAQVLALADRFDYLTSVSEGRPLMTPFEALRDLQAQMASDPGKMIFDPKLVAEVLKLFPKMTEESQSGSVSL